MVKGELSFSATGLTLLAMLAYGFASLISDTISFDYRIAIGGILFIFIIEILAYRVELWYKKKK